MENTEKISTAKQLAALKMLLVQYGVLHESLKFQFELYLLCCAPRSLGGEVALDFSNKRFICYIYFDYLYSRVKINGVYKHKQLKNKDGIKKTFFDLSKHDQKLYKQQAALAVNNLKRWYSELSWGNETNVVVYIDGVENGIHVKDKKRLSGKKENRKRKVNK